MKKHVSIAGKGGTGKTTLSALMVKRFCEVGKTPVLAVDSDPNSNLGEALGIKVEGTVAEILASVKDIDAVPTGMTKHAYLEYRLHTALTETKKFDLLTMGGPEGPGCYCAPNDILRSYIGQLCENYSRTVMDNEAGLEHLSRRVAQDVDVMLVTSDPTMRGVRSAARIGQLVRTLKLDYKEMYFVLIRASEEQADELGGEIEKIGMPLGGVIPQDPAVGRFDVEGRPLFDLDSRTPAYVAVCEMLERVGV